MNPKNHSRFARVALLPGLSLALAIILTAPRLVRAAPGTPPATPPAQAQVAAGPRTITFAYDAAGRLTQVEYEQDKLVVFTYDSTGNLQQYTVKQMLKVYLPLVLRHR